MRMFRRIVSLVLILVLFNIFILANSYANPDEVILKAGTALKLILIEEVSCYNKRVNEEVFLKVAREVVIGGKTVIERGTPAFGVVELVQRRGRIGREGVIKFSVLSTETADGQSVMLRSTYTRLGYDKETLSIVLGVTICPLFLLMRGTDDSFQEGTILKAYTENDIVINVEQ